ncbi:hypothetical protein PVAND_017247 [Polypedilum vanderplanki]|uniref:Peptidase S1 domain-containing protein n=1 Tax=Polypedilum vanderplanki TaxID=319348 RepID=A0A9J6BIH3_POLVA|nr:hypothetical protein PVAND_017247 [Polypedilum vanderplanki]
MPSTFSIRTVATCGISKFERKNSEGLIINGAESKPGEWPWYVSIFRRREFICGSSLISDLHLLSAAHCFEYFGSYYELNDYFVLLGRFNLEDDNEKFFVSRNFSAIFLHPKYNQTAEAYRSNSDISMIRMSQKVQFSDFIQPVCLPESNSNSANLYGTVVGYGKSETDKIHEMTPRQAQMYSISFSECLLKAPIYSYIVSSRSICVGGTNSIPCLGDSGGGFFVKNSKSGQYEVKGIVSQAKRTNGCDPKDFVAFVDVAKFIDWIQIQMKDGINAKIKTTKVKEKVNLCESPSCGPNSKCSAPFGSIICTCLDDAIGNPPNCEKPECFDDFDCDENRACFKNKCKNLCEIKACKENEKCEMKNHKRECFSKNCLIGNLLVNNQCMENLNLVTGTISSSRCCEWLSGDIPIDRNLQIFGVNIGTKIQTETAVINPKYQSEEIEEFAIFNYLCGDKLCDLKSNIKNLPIQVNKIFPNLLLILQ